MHHIEESRKQSMAFHCFVCLFVLFCFLSFIEFEAGKKINTGKEKEIDTCGLISENALAQVQSLSKNCSSLQMFYQRRNSWCQSNNNHNNNE